MTSAFQCKLEMIVLGRS